jgi:hypothetical protein
MTKPRMGISSLSPGNRISITIFYLFLSQESIYDLSQQRYDQAQDPKKYCRPGDSLNDQAQEYAIDFDPKNLVPGSDLLLSQIPDQARPYSIYIFHFYYLFLVHSIYS